MPLFTPGRRWQEPYYPFKQIPVSHRMLALAERWIKGPLFGCRMCGNCLLQETAFICPMECAKSIRNGPCGGSTSEHCYVDPTRPCIWYAIYDRAERMGRSDKLLEVLPPLDWDKVGTETWLDVYHEIRKVGINKWFTGITAREPAARARAWDSVFYPVRQPIWWQGDAEYHPPKYTQPASELERRLQAGEFVVTAEIAPPLSLDTTKFQNSLAAIRGMVAAVNFTDNAAATPRVSSQACSVLALQHSVEPVFQIAARDHSRLSLQSEVLGANALGIRNILCLSGDSARVGPAPRARMDGVDIDSIQMLWILRRMRDDGKYLDGRAMKQPPLVFLGAAASPLASEPRFQALREEKKVNAGAQYFQTNAVFDSDALEVWLNELAKRNILNKVHILVGIIPLKTSKMTQHIYANVPGSHVPERVLKRMQAAGDGAEKEGLTIALELIDRVRRLQGIHGIHLMAVGWEAIISRIVQQAGLIPATVSLDPTPIRAADLDLAFPPASRN